MSSDPRPDRASSVGQQFDLGPVDQISFAVNDMDAAMAVFEPLFGQFTTRESDQSQASVVVRGRTTRAVLKLGFCRVGELEIELVEVLRGDWPTVEHLREHGPGLHHVRFVIADLENKVEAMARVGFNTVVEGTSPRGSRFAYLEARDILGPSMIELLQPSGG